MNPLRVLASLLAVVWLAGCASDPKPVGLPQTADTLAGSRWYWLGEVGGPQTLTVDEPSRYRVVFGPGGQLQVQADCNLGSSRWQLADGVLRIAPIATTKLGCPSGSRGTDFLRSLERPSRPLLRDGLLELVGEDGQTMRLAARPDTRWAAFRCDDGPMTVLFQGDTARVDFDGDRLRLPAAPSGSGYRYAQGDYELRGKGGEAMLLKSGRPLSGPCQAP